MQDISSVNLDTFIESNQTVLLDFWAPWCAPCKAFAGVLSDVETRNTSVAIGKVNVDDYPDLAERFMVQSLPTTLVFRNGKQSNRLIGMRSSEDIENLLGK